MNNKAENNMNKGPKSISDNMTEITLTAGDTVIPALLNNCRSSKELISRLPFTIRLSRYEHDYCGMMESLSYDKEDLQNGWKNGNIAFAADGSYFAILYKDQEMSGQFGNLVTLGRINCPLSIMDTLDSSITVTIDLKA